jgi:twitching motility protein PilT
VSEQSVMVVNDDPGYFERIKQTFDARGNGFDVFNAISGARAVGLATAKQPAAVIVDGDMVGVDGYDLTRELKALPELASTPVVIVAASPDEASALKARQAGAAAHMCSAGDANDVVQKVATLLGVPAPAAAPAPAPADPAPAAAPSQPGAEATYGVPEQVQQPDGYGAPEPVQPSAGYGVPEPVAPRQSTTAAVPAADPLPGYSMTPASELPGYTASPAPAQPTIPVSPSGPSGGGKETPHVDDLLWTMINRGGSDLHLTVGSPPGIRLRGEIMPIEEQPILTPKDTQTMILNLLSEEQRKRFETELELDFAYSIPGVSRFRANVFQQRNSMGAVFRVIPLNIPTMQDLSLPKVCKYLSERPRGLVLVTGPTGSGKSTTLAAMVDHINATRRVHIITLEDPIEFMHKNKQAYVNQREVGEDTHSFADALKRVLRQDPDVILVGEMRDLETIQAAVTAAETGHLVLATLHTTGGPATVDRIIDVFPPHQQQQIRMQLSGTLEGVLSQVLLRSTDGKSRVMAMEIMLGVPAIANLIREGKTHQMLTIIQGGAQLGMQTLDQHLKTLLQGGKVTYEEAMSKATNPRELAQMIGKK